MAVGPICLTFRFGVSSRPCSLALPMTVSRPSYDDQNQTQLEDGRGASRRGLS